MSKKGALIIFLTLLVIFLIMTSCKGGLVPPDPNIPVVEKTAGPDNGQVINVNNAEFQWNGNDQMAPRVITNYQYKKDEEAWRDVDPPTVTTYTWDLIAEGIHTFSVKAQDDEQNESQPAIWNFTYTAAATPTYTLTVEASPAAGGDIQIEAQGWKNTDTTTVDENTEVEIRAQAAQGYTFNGWYEGSVKISDNNPYTVTVDENKTIEAKFTEVHAGGPNGEWDISAHITLGEPPNQWEGDSDGETNVQISQDLEHITGNATMIIPPVSPRNIRGFSRVVLKSGTTLLMREIFPILRPSVDELRDGNTIIADESGGFATMEFDISFNHQDVVQAILTVGFLGEDYQATITRNRDNEGPNEVQFRVDVPGLEAVYEVTATR